MNSNFTYALRTIYLWILIGVVVTMTFNIENVNVNGIFIGFLSVVTIIHALISKQKPTLTSTPVVILLMAFYILHAAGILYSQNQKEAWFVLEKKLSLILLPVLFIFGPRLNGKETKAVLLSFVASCILVCILCLAIATSKFVQTKDITFFYYQSLSINIGMHAAYLAMYLCFAIAILLFLSFNEKATLRSNQKALYFISIIAMSLVIFMLSARTQIVILMIEIAIYFIFVFNLNKSPLKSILLSSLIICALLGTALLFPGTRERFKEAINYNNEYALSKKWGEKQMRYLIWKSALEASGTNLLIGTGTGDVQDDLQKIYIEKEYISLTYFENTKFNAHNQYFETLIGLGIIGLLVFLSVISVAIRNASKGKNAIYLISVLIFAASCITESMLERQNGIVFFSFFSVFLLVNKYSKEKN